MTASQVSSDINSAESGGGKLLRSAVGAGITPVNKKLIYFICTSNICRSPMAEAILNSKSESCGYYAKSAGIFVNPGQPITMKTIAALKAAGIAESPDNRYSLHESQCISEELLAAADTIYAINKRHAITLLKLFPEYSKKFTWLGDIYNPSGMNLNTHIKCCMQIKSLIYDTFGLRD